MHRDVLLWKRIPLDFGYMSAHSCLLIVQGMSDAMTVNTMSNLGTPHFNDLPHDLQASIFNRLSTQERAQVAAVCRVWYQVSNATWTSVHLRGEGMKDMQAWLEWLQIISIHSSGSLGCIRLSIDEMLGDLVNTQS